MLLKKDAAIIAKAEVLYLEKKAEYTMKKKQNTLYVTGKER